MVHDGSEFKLCEKRLNDIKNTYNWLHACEKLIR